MKTMLQTMVCGFGLGVMVLSGSGCTTKVELGNNTEAGASDVPVSEVAPMDVPVQTDGATGCRGERNGLPCCSEDLNGGGGQDWVTIRFPLTIVQALEGVQPSGDAGPVGRWTGSAVTAQYMGAYVSTTPVTQMCVNSFVTQPPSLPCTASTVMQFQVDGEATPRDVLVGVTMADAARIASGTRVNVSYRAAQGLSGGFGELVVERASDGVMLMALVSLARPNGQTPLFDRTTYGPFQVGIDTPGFCENSEQSPCRRLFVASSLRVQAGSNSARIDPTATQMVTSSTGRYNVTHRQIVTRENGGCADLRQDTYSFEIVRLGD